MGKVSLQIPRFTTVNIVYAVNTETSRKYEGSATEVVLASLLHVLGVFQMLSEPRLCQVYTGEENRLYLLCGD